MNDENNQGWIIINKLQGINSWWVVAFSKTLLKGVCTNDRHAINIANIVAHHHQQQYGYFGSRQQQPQLL
jgi:hypothetical protein